MEIKMTILFLFFLVVLQGVHSGASRLIEQQCDASNIYIEQNPMEGEQTGPVRDYNVYIRNDCLTCSATDILVNCEKYAWVVTDDPEVFDHRSPGNGVCQILKHRLLAPKEFLTFRYSQYPGPTMTIDKVNFCA